jgi:hypothetical protein
MSGAVIEDFTPVIKASLRGFARVRMPSGTIYHDVGIHQSDDTWWAIPASKARIGRDGMQLKDPAGKLLWSPVVTFVSTELRTKFSEAVIAALRKAHPEVFQ